jgi:uncharacterized metal-binding protein YceD (DUF177 family)
MTDDQTDDALPSPIERNLLTTDVPGEGRHVSVKPSAEELAALVAFSGVEAIRSFTAEIDVRPWGKTGFRVTGRVTADVVQACVVTLDPVDGHVDETVDVKLAPIADVDRYKPASNPGEIVVDIETDDIPDFFDGPAIDVGAIAVEYFMLGLDPYPRKPGIEFTPLPDPGKAEVSPFAKLATLKKPEQG